MYTYTLGKIKAIVWCQCHFVTIHTCICIFIHVHVYVYTQNAHIHTHTYIQICFRSHHYNLTIHVCVLEQPIHTTPTYQPPSYINHSISDRIRSSYIPIWSSHSFSYGRVSQTISYSFFLHSLACPPNHQSRLWTKKSVKLYTQHISSTAATSNHSLVSLRYTSQSQFSPSRIIHTRPAHILTAVFSSSSHLANSSIDYRALIRIPSHVLMDSAAILSSLTQSPPRVAGEGAGITSVGSDLPTADPTNQVYTVLYTCMCI